LGIESGLFAGGIERAGVNRTGRGGATCRVGIGEGIGVRFRFGPRTKWAWAVLRAGFVARARLTAALRDFPARTAAFALRGFGPFEVDRRRAFGLADRCETLFLSRFNPASLFRLEFRTAGWR